MSKDQSNNEIANEVVDRVLEETMSIDDRMKRIADYEYTAKKLVTDNTGIIESVATMLKRLNDPTSIEDRINALCESVTKLTTIHLATIGNNLIEQLDHLTLQISTEQQIIIHLQSKEREN